MVGGGQGAFIGAVHRMAAALDGRWVFCAGALSSTPERSKESGRALGLADARNYGTWREMLAGELKLPVGERVDGGSIVRANASQGGIAGAFVRAGFNVIGDKPMTATLAEAERLAAAVREAGVVLCVTYNYTGYPMVREAAARVRGGGAGAIGAVRKVFVEYHQGWLAKGLEGTGQKQASWRTDPALAGAGGAIGDIGTHAENLVSTITGLEIEALCADLTSFVPGRKLDDDASVLLRFKGGAKGVLTASQVCVGEQNALTIRVHGERGSLSWRQEQPERLEWAREDGTVEVTVRGVANIGPSRGGAASDSRLPPGHPEGFVEAFANVYAGAAGAIRAQSTQGRFPGIEDGVRGVRFVTRVVESSRGGARWVEF
mgnify:CR=1 FL=1